jgi:F-type H+-transporting ATPase subunit b
VELSWSTFVLEIVNFLVLVWILQRFLYRPVLAIIDERRAGIEKTLADAKALREEAEGAKSKYEGRIADWEAERQRAREALADDLEAERAKRLEALQAELTSEREKAAVANARREAEARRSVEEAALKHGSQFASTLLRSAAGPELEARLIDTAAAGIESLTPEKAAELRGDEGRVPESLRVESAYELSAAQRERLEAALTALLGRSVPATFVRDASLVAGVRVTLGSRVLGLNVRDELEGFAGLANE